MIKNKSSKQKPSDIKNIIKKAIDDIKKRIPKHKYNDNIYDMYLTHIVPYLINKVDNITLNDVESSLNQFISNKRNPLDKMISEYLAEISDQITCPCRD